jgi:hypothetical protein
MLAARLLEPVTGSLHPFVALHDVTISAYAGGYFLTYGKYTFDWSNKRKNLHIFYAFQALTSKS